MAVIKRNRCLRGPSSAAILSSRNLRGESESARDSDPNSVAKRPKWGDILISLRVS